MVRNAERDALRKELKESLALGDNMTLTCRVLYPASEDTVAVNCEIGKEGKFAESGMDPTILKRCYVSIALGVLGACMHEARLDPDDHIVLHEKVMGILSHGEKSLATALSLRHIMSDLKATREHFSKIEEIGAMEKDIDITS